MRVRPVNPGRRASTRYRARRREARARRDHSQLDLVHFEFDESHACGLRWRKRARRILRSYFGMFPSREKTSDGLYLVPELFRAWYRRNPRRNKISARDSESSRAFLARLGTGQQGRCANELAPSVTAIRTIAPRAFARRWTEQPRPRGARDVRVALESRPASVAPREVPAGDSKSPREAALDKIPPCRRSRLRRALPWPEARAWAETENTPRGAARRLVPLRAPRFARLSPVPGRTRAFPPGRIARIRAGSFFLVTRRTSADRDPKTRTRWTRFSARWRERALRRAPRSRRAARRSMRRVPRLVTRRRLAKTPSASALRVWTRRARARARRASSAPLWASFPATPYS